MLLDASDRIRSDSYECLILKIVPYESYFRQHVSFNQCIATERRTIDDERVRILFEFRELFFRQIILVSAMLLPSTPLKSA